MSFSEDVIVECLRLSGIKSRMSSKFISQLKELFDDGFDLTKVTEVISYLEGNENRKSVKKPKKFSRGKLKGLYHCHFLGCAASAMSENFLKFFDRPEYIDDLIGNAINQSAGMDANDQSKYMAEKFLSTLEHELDSKRKYTGNWLIYGIKDDKKYYLMMCSHPETGEDTDLIFDSLKNNCGKDFAFFFNRT